MNPDTTENNQPMGLTKNKRDQFIVEIRKKKNMDEIRKKRIKFFTNDQLQNNPDMALEDMMQAHTSQKALQDVERIRNLSEDVITIPKFFDILEKAKASSSQGRVFLCRRERRLG
jgi:hypothetical protein